MLYEIQEVGLGFPSHYVIGFVCFPLSIAWTCLGKLLSFQFLVMCRGKHDGKGNLVVQMKKMQKNFSKFTLHKLDLMQAGGLKTVAHATRGHPARSTALHVSHNWSDHLNHIFLGPINLLSTHSISRSLRRNGCARFFRYLFFTPLKFHTPFNIIKSPLKGLNPNWEISIRKSRGSAASPRGE